MHGPCAPPTPTATPGSPPAALPTTAAAAAPEPAPAGPAAASGPWRASIVIEWENLRWSEHARCSAMLAELARQLPRCLQPPADGAQDIELLVAHDPTAVDGAQVRAAVLRSLAPWPRRCRLALVPTEAGGYYALKNEGARVAAGDIVVFLDSDVIPEPGWLTTLLAAFDDPRVEVVGGNCYLATDGLVARTMALAWFFPLRDAQGTLRPRQQFFANNVAFRREVALRHPFPALPGSSRGACRLLARTLVNRGCGLFLHGGARVQHPPPHGWRHLLRRALSHGRDNLLLDRASGGGSLRASARRVLHAQGRAVKRIVRHRGRVGLRALALPAALALAVGYYTLYAAGDGLTRVAPGWAGRHLPV